MGYDLGRRGFTQEDPIGLASGLNLYGFAQGDPVNFSDPFGLTSDTVRVEGARLRETVGSERARNREFRRLYDRLHASPMNYVFISSELEPESLENDPDFTGFATTNDPAAFPAPILSPEFQGYWPAGTTAGIMIGINSPKVRQVIGHEMVHLLGMEEIGRLYGHPDPHRLWRVFPIP